MCGGQNVSSRVAGAANSIGAEIAGAHGRGQIEDQYPGSRSAEGRNLDASPRWPGESHHRQSPYSAHEQGPGSSCAPSLTDAQQRQQLRVHDPRPIAVVGNGAREPGREQQEWRQVQKPRSMQEEQKTQKPTQAHHPPTTTTGTLN